MIKQEQASQLRLAAGILETGHPWESLPSPDAEWARHKLDPIAALSWGHEIRIILATPPDGRALHNPDNLTAEQVGVGYRLGLVGEILPDNYEYWHAKQWNGRGRGCAVGMALNRGRATRRLPLSVPWPELPIAELPKSLVELDAGQHAAVEAVLKETIHAEPFQLPPPPPGVTVPLGPRDVPPGSILKANSWAAHEWRSVDHVYSEGALLSNCPTTHRWEDLMRDYQINRSLPLTGKWNPATWEPCSKTIPA